MSTRLAEDTTFVSIQNNSFPLFFSTYWTFHANVLDGHIVYFGPEQSCYSFLFDLERFFEKRFLHLDAVLMIYHPYRILEADTGLSIALRSSDTDDFILL